MARHLQNAPIHGGVVVSGGDDQVGPGDQPVVVDLVVVHQRAARRLGDADAFEVVHAGVGAHVADRALRDRCSSCSIFSSA